MLVYMGHSDWSQGESDQISALLGAVEDYTHYSWARVIPKHGPVEENKIELIQSLLPMLRARCT